MYFDNFLDSVFATVSQKHSFHESITKELLPIKSVLSQNGTEKIVVSVNKRVFSGIIAGVDSGFVSKRLSFIDIVLIRVAGAIFNYENNILGKAEYYPNAFSLPEPILLKAALEKDEEQQSVSLERLKKEVCNSIEIIEKFKPKYLFIDGSIVPQYQDKPRSDSVINNDYNSVVVLFQKMYSLAEKNSCTLISCVEDSRGTRFIQLLREKILSKGENQKSEKLKGSIDAAFLDYFLLPKERTFCFPYTSSTITHPILKDYEKRWAENIFVFYLKVSEFDKPLRVEFISGAGNLHEKADEIASIVFSLSSLHKEYSYPSVLIEADLRARLNEDDISIVYDKLIDKLGPKMRLRRNSRPFK